MLPGLYRQQSHSQIWLGSISRAEISYRGSDNYQQTTFNNRKQKESGKQDRVRANEIRNSFKLTHSMSHTTTVNLSGLGGQLGAVVRFKMLDYCSSQDLDDVFKYGIHFREIVFRVLITNIAGWNI